ncbi:MAG: ATP-binding protein [Deltaproteobacteria bacterium]|nr:ATP-binding protein [Deltaproteobacteria bacterium]
MIDRKIEPILRDLATQYPVVTLTGPRQSGKTTLCRKVFPDMAYANLESPDVRQYAVTDPRGFLAAYTSGVILDEIQRAPQLVSYIQVIVDERKTPGQFILTGSQQFEVTDTINQSLAGRTGLLRLLPFSIAEIQGKTLPDSVDMMLLKGFYPRIHDQGLNPTQALGDYYETYAERDLRQLTSIRDLNVFQKFIRLCAGRIGQVVNMQSLANDTGVSHTTVMAWLSVLEAGYIIFLLQPWYRNISRRLIKSPKLYFYDVGLAAYLLGIENEIHVSRDPLRGNLFENLALMEAIKYRFNRGKKNTVTFYRDSRGNEVDMILESGREVFPLEVKAGATITDDFFKGLRHFSRVIGEPPYGGGLIYGGREIQKRGNFHIYPVTAMDEMLDKLNVSGFGY